MSHFARTVTSVGGAVVRDGCLLVARMTYSPTSGQYMLPGGVVENGETLEEAVVREVREETGVAARATGVIGLGSLVHQGVTHTYVLWSLEPLSGSPVADGLEIDDCCYLPFEQLAARPDVTYLVKYVAARLQTGRFSTHGAAADFAPDLASLGLDAWKLLM
jgi:ADP-ribose pyrophosphatase YjhB (NUDIX family)